MKKKIINIDQIITLIFSFLTVLIIIYFSIKRFMPRISKTVFEPAYFEQGLVYLIFWIINFILISSLVKFYLIKNNDQNNIIYLLIHDINNWTQLSFTKITVLLTKIPYIDYPISYMTHYFLKIPPKILKILSYIVQIMMLLALTVDIFYLQQFYYSYKIIYIFIFDILIRIIVFISETFNYEIGLECFKSIKINNYEKLAEDRDNLTDEDYILTPYNTQFESVKHVCRINELLAYENDLLTDLKKYLEKPFIFQFIKRVYYLFLWSYVLYYYPYPVIYVIFTLCNNLIIPYKSIIILITIALLIIKINKSNKK